MPLTEGQLLDVLFCLGGLGQVEQSFTFFMWLGFLRELSNVVRRRQDILQAFARALKLRKSILSRTACHFVHELGVGTLVRWDAGTEVHPTGKMGDMNLWLETMYMDIPFVESRDPHGWTYKLRNTLSSLFPFPSTWPPHTTRASPDKLLSTDSPEADEMRASLAPRLRRMTSH